MAVTPGFKRPLPRSAHLPDVNGAHGACFPFEPMLPLLQPPLSLEGKLHTQFPSSMAPPTRLQVQTCLPRGGGARKCGVP